MAPSPSEEVLPEPSPQSIDAEKSAAVRLGVGLEKETSTASVNGRPSGKTVLTTWLLPGLASHGAVLMLAVVLMGAAGFGSVKNTLTVNDAPTRGGRLTPGSEVKVTVPLVAPKSG